MRDTGERTMREKYGNEAPPEVASLTPEQAYAYGWNSCLNATMRGIPPVMPNPEAAPDVAVECERLMGWPDDHTALGVDEQGREYALADTARYKACGNGVASPVAAWIAFRLRDALDTPRERA